MRKPAVKPSARIAERKAEAAARKLVAERVERRGKVLSVDDWLAERFDLRSIFPSKRLVTLRLGAGAGRAGRSSGPDLGSQGEGAAG